MFPLIWFSLFYMNHEVQHDVNEVKQNQQQSSSLSGIEQFM